MMQDALEIVRKYTDALFASFIRTTQDGRRVIYPWGILGDGYVIATDEDEERLKTLYAVYVVAVTALMGAAFSLGGLAGGLCALAVSLACYGVYVKRLTAGMEPAGGRPSFVEAYRAQARRFGLRQLWSFVFCGAVMIVLGIVVIVTDFSGTIAPRLGVLPELLIFFGLGSLTAAFGVWMLILRAEAERSDAADSTVVKSVVAEELGFYVTGQLGPVRAWFLAIFGLVLSGLGLFVFMVDPANRTREAAGFIAIFGLIAAWGIAEIVLRYRERHGRSM